MNLSQIRNLVRKYVGMPSVDQISNEDLNSVINRFYREKLPILVDAPELYSEYSFQTQQSVRQYSLSEKVLKVVEPVWLDDTPISVTHDRSLFFALYPLDKDTEAKPAMCLLDGKTIWLSPTPDGQYTVKFTALQKPEELVQEDSEPLNPSWAELIALGASIYVLTEQGDMQAALELSGLLKAEISLIRQGDLQLSSGRQVIRKF